MCQAIEKSAPAEWEEFSQQVLLALRHWCNSAKLYDRQWKHVMLTVDRNCHPPREALEAAKLRDRPAGVLPDDQLDTADPAPSSPSSSSSSSETSSSESTSS